MKLKLSLLSCILSWIMLAQSAPAYYNTVDFSQRGNTLKTQLSNLIIITHTHKTSYNDLKWIYKTSDVDPKNPKNILLIYGSENSGIHERSRIYSGSWNREHVFPNSKGNPKLGKTGPGSDAHHLRPADTSLNSNRGNSSFDDGIGEKAYRTSRGGWYPGDEWKGDVARIMMYMYVRYKDRAQPLFATLPPATYSSDFPDILLKWNVEDPVSDFERNRNNVVANIQHNRNPFIDNPYLATLIWGGPAAENTWPETIGGGGEGDNVAPTIPTHLTLDEATSSSIIFRWDASTDDVEVRGYEVYVNQQFIKNVYTNQATLSGLSPDTTYSLTVKAFDTGGNKSMVSDALTLRTSKDDDTSGSTTCGTEDFEQIISTGSNPTASTYTDRTWTNHGITWTATEARTDISIDGDSKAICMRKGSLRSSTIAGGIGSLSVKTQLQFTGNSGNYILKINGIQKGLIPYSKDEQTYTINDINVAGNVVIELVDETTNNRVAFDDLSWTCYSGLSTLEPKPVDNQNNEQKQWFIYPNPVKNNVVYVNGIEGEQTLEIYNMNGQLIQVMNHIKNHQQLPLNSLPKGMYLIKGKDKTIKMIVE